MPEIRCGTQQIPIRWDLYGELLLAHILIDGIVHDQYHNGKQYREQYEEEHAACVDAFKERRKG